MTKNDVIRLFGKQQKEAARALGIGKSAFSQWPHQLQRHHIARVIGTAVLMGKHVPEDLLIKCKNLK